MAGRPLPAASCLSAELDGQTGVADACHARHIRSHAREGKAAIMVEPSTTSGAAPEPVLAQPASTSAATVLTAEPLPYAPGEPLELAAVITPELSLQEPSGPVSSQSESAQVYQHADQSTYIGGHMPSTPHALGLLAATTGQA
eukprot:scaffold87587_cov20-Prasinocladus_malaysianus.AAC.1